MATTAFDALASRIDAAGLRGVGFTSSVFGEGVSTIALGTAMSLAALRRENVLLVDANWLRPSLTEDARLESAPGLADYFVKDLDLGAVTRELGPSRLAFLPIGDRGAARPTRRALSSFLADGAASFGAVIVDLPPALAGEPFVVPWASVLDQIFVVVREAATPFAMVQQAMKTVTVGTTPHVVINEGVDPGRPSRTRAASRT
jgi:Mrp family chromosome partitioning ATPase